MVSEGVLAGACDFAVCLDLGLVWILTIPASLASEFED